MRLLGHNWRLAVMFMTLSANSYLEHLVSVHENYSVLHITASGSCHLNIAVFATKTFFWTLLTRKQQTNCLAWLVCQLEHKIIDLLCLVEYDVMHMCWVSKNFCKIHKIGASFVNLQTWFGTILTNFVKFHTRIKIPVENILKILNEKVRNFAMIWASSLKMYCKYMWEGSK